MSKNLNISILMDFYGDFLTEKQAEALDYYYNQDYSLYEIAGHMNISRQGVHDFIKRGEKMLIEFEDKLHLVQKRSKLYFLLESLYSDIETLDLNGDILTKLKNTLSDIKDNL